MRSFRAEMCCRFILGVKVFMKPRFHGSGRFCMACIACSNQSIDKHFDSSMICKLKLLSVGGNFFGITFFSDLSLKNRFNDFVSFPYIKQPSYDMNL